MADVQGLEAFVTMIVHVDTCVPRLGSALQLLVPGDLGNMKHEGLDCTLVKQQCPEQKQPARDLPECCLAKAVRGVCMLKCCLTFHVVAAGTPISLGPS